jgi:hypothetical protein
MNRIVHMMEPIVALHFEIPCCYCFSFPLVILVCPSAVLLFEAFFSSAFA